MKKQLVFVAALIALALGSRIIPHWPNFTAMIAVAFTGGMLFGKRIEAIVLPLLILLAGDFVINNTLYSTGEITWFTGGFGYIYGSYLLIALLGVLNQNKSKLVNALGLLSSSLLFYLITNFGVWLGNPLYSQDLGGLLTSYTAGLPFLLNSMASALFYGVVIFAAKSAVENSMDLKEA